MVEINKYNEVSHRIEMRNPRVVQAELVQMNFGGSRDHIQYHIKLKEAGSKDTVFLRIDHRAITKFVKAIASVCPNCQSVSFIDNRYCSTCRPDVM